MLIPVRINLKSLVTNNSSLTYYLWRIVSVLNLFNNVISFKSFQQDWKEQNRDTFLLKTQTSQVTLYEGLCTQGGNLPTLICFNEGK